MNFAQGFYMKYRQISGLFAFLFLLLSICPQAEAAQRRQSRAAAPSAPSVAVFSFGVNAADMAGVKEDLPKLIAQRLTVRGFRANVQRGEAQSSAAARSRAGGSAYALYGNFNQLGDAFTLDGFLVSARGGEEKHVAVQKSGLINLLPAVDELVERLVAELPAPGASAAGVEGEAPRVPGGGLTDIQVRGTKVLDPDVVLMRLSIRKGDNPDEKAINDEVRRVWDMGYFSDVHASLEQGGKVLVFTVQEKPRIDNIIVDGSDKVSRDDIIAAMSTKTGSVLNEKVLADDMQKVTELYRKEGYYLATVNHKIEQRPGGTGSVLTLNVVEGKKLYIKRVDVEGLKEIKKGDLEDYMALRPRGMLSFFTGTGVLKDEYLDRDSNAIAAYGMNEGFIDIQVSAPKVTYDPDGIVITYTVNEGRRYKLGEIVFEGELIDTEERLKQVIKLPEHKKEKTYFSVNVMQEDTKRLTQFYGDYGYAFAEVDSKVFKPEGEDPVVNVAYIINKKQKVFIRRVSVEGNAKTRDNVILREMRLADGDQYDGAKLRRSNERLTRLRYFKSVDSELVPTDVPDEVDLKMKVKEDNTGSIMGGIGYSTFYDVGVSASIMERNLFGKGYWAQLQGFFSWRRTSGIFSLTNPRVNDTELLLGNDMYYTVDHWDDFTKETVGDTIRVAYPVGEYSTVGLSYRLERYNLYDISSYASRSISDYQGYNWTSAVRGSFTRDTTDNRERPTKGTITRFFTEYGGGGIGGDDNFVKAVADWQMFYSFLPGHTAHVRGRLGGVWENEPGTPVPVFERFWVGGIDTIRGYSYTNASPRDPKYWDHIGGDRMGVGNVEYIWTFQKELGLALVPFTDFGFNLDSRYMELNDRPLLWSAGLELRWRSPMGDLRIAYGVPLTENYDKEYTGGRFEFTMGHFF